MTSFLIDLAIIGIVAFCAWRGYKNGLIRGVFGVVSLFVSIAVASAAAMAYSKDAKPIIMPFVSGIIDSTLSEMDEEGIEYQPLAHDHEISDPAFGTAYTVLRQIGLPEASAVNLAKQVAEDPGSDAGLNAFIDSLAEKATDTFSYVAVFGIAFLILAIVFAVIGNLIGFVFSLPGLKLVDTISGSVLGLIKGIIIVLTIAAIVRYFGFLAIETVEKTSVLNSIINGNAVANAIGV